jgi:molecular chaperone DnaK (HSP70)
MTEPVLGIDLGTRYALTAVPVAGKGVVVVPSRWGGTRTPSVTSWTSMGWRAGEDAARGEMKNPSTTWWDVKRKLGTEWKARCGRAAFGAEEVLVPLLTLLREDAEAFLGVFLSSCVLTVPASFSFAERSSIARSARSAGFSAVRIVNEPTAAALAFGMAGKFLILDYGAGTVDLSVVESEDGVWQVLESTGIPSSGGRDFDTAFAEWLIGKMNIPRLEEHDPLWRTLLSEAEGLKIALSSCLSCEWTPPAGVDSPPVRVTRKEFEELIRPSLENVTTFVKRLWKKFRPSKLLLVGGGSRIPLLRSLLEERVARPEHLNQCPDESVVTGAALYGIAPAGERLLLDVLSQDLGILAADGSPVSLLKKGAHLPVRAERRFISVGEGAFTMSVFQGEDASRKIIASVRASEARKDEEITLSFSVDSDGLLRIDIIRSDGRVSSIAPLELGEPAPPPSAEAPREVLDLEKRFSRLSMELSPAQQARVAALFRTMKSLGEGGFYSEGFDSLTQMVSEMERIVR